jgi:alkanesulfonate monooxygenase SsuD/methylene tetrahydromethanopterin reductase-like flavin-dependent oxidoreductase (luciferase family)
MKIGMNLPVMVPGLDRDTILQWARRVDVGPYSSLAAGERITFPNPEIMVTMGAAAAATERVRLALTVVVLPMHSPVLIAKQVATLDVISGGRVTLGLGIGARAEDYRAVGAPFDARRLRKMEGQIALMRRVWAGENVVEGAGRPVEPFPVQPGGPELLAGALAPDSVRRAARWADGICGFSFGPSAEEIGSAFDTARQAWTEAERTKAPRLVTSFWFALGSRAREQLDEYLKRYLAFMGEDLAAALVPMVTTTSAAALRAATRMVEDLGADELILVPTTSDPEEVERVADILG